MTVSDQESTIDFAPGAMVADFELIRELGRGTSGVVYLARQCQLDRVVALKVLMPEVAANPVYVRNFLREARVAARLNHPNVVRAYDVGTDKNGICYFAMEYVDGKPLEKIRVRAPHLLTQAFLISTMSQLADALGYAWEKFHLTHGDIKPENLLIRNADHVLKLADLGLARVSGSEEQGEIMATPLYAAPEIILGKGEAGPCSDIYSFGAMLYELVSGVPPFDSDDVDEVVHRHVYEIPKPLIQVNPDVDVALSDFTAAMLAKDPAERPQSWMEIRDFLRDAALKYDTRNTLVSGGDAAASSRHKAEKKNAMVAALRALPWGRIAVGIGIAITASLLIGIAVLMTMHH